MSYPGGKSQDGVYQRLISLMPPHDGYIEPFLGGGALLLRKRPARCNIGVDRDPAVMARWQQLVAIASGGDPISAPADMQTDAQLLVAIASSGGAISLHQGCGLAFLAQYAFTGRELVYCDPPYVRASRRDQTRDRYRFEMTDTQHEALVALLRRLPCLVMVSGYRSALYLDGFHDWTTRTYPVRTRGRTPATEYLWMNYPMPTALHDYRYLGNDFREREQLKRLQQRWITRFDRMAPLKLQAMFSVLAARFPAAIVGVGGGVSPMVSPATVDDADEPAADGIATADEANEPAADSIATADDANEPAADGPATVDDAHVDDADEPATDGIARRDDGDEPVRVPTLAAPSAAGIPLAGETAAPPVLAIPSAPGRPWDDCKKCGHTHALRYSPHGTRLWCPYCQRLA